jgi:hypothetical protein
MEILYLFLGAASGILAMILSVYGNWADTTFFVFEWTLIFMILVFTALYIREFV